MVFQHRPTDNRGKADIDVRGTGSSLALAFAQAALVLTVVITEEPVAATEVVMIACASPSRAGGTSQLM